MKYFIASILLLSQLSYAEDYTPYTKLSFGYIFHQPEYIEYKDNKQKQKLYTGDKTSYTIEAGITVANYNFGVGWSDLLNQKGNIEGHRPYKFEVFGEHYWKFKYFDVKVGTGFKLYEERFINRYDGDTYLGKSDQYGGFGNLKDRFTARLSITKRFGDYEVGIGHNSQWFIGRPFSDKFEYYKTEIVVSYIF